MMRAMQRARESQGDELVLEADSRGFEEEEASPPVRGATVIGSDPPIDHDSSAASSAEQGKVVRIRSSISMPRSIRSSVNAIKVTVSDYSETIRLPAGCLATSSVFGVLLVVALYVVKNPVFSEGAFGFVTPVLRNESLDTAAFEEARWFLLAGGDIPNTEGIGATNERFTWRRIVLMYQGLDGAAVSLDAVQTVEVSLRELPSWRRLCTESVPQDQRRLCNPGDSFVGAAFGTRAAVSEEARLKGVLDNITLDGQAEFLEVPVDDLLWHLRRNASRSLQRWLPNVVADDFPAMRTVFAFYLPEEIAEKSWSGFILNEVEPHLLAMREDGPIKVFYVVDGIQGLEDREVGRALKEYLPWLFLGPLSILAATMLVTQRLALALSAMFLATVAPVSASIGLAEGHPDGTSHLPAVALAAWNCVAVACADMACACARASEVWKYKARVPELPVSRKIAWFLAEAFAPQFCIGCLLCLLSFTCAELPLVAEFAWHAGIGLGVAIGLALSLYPSAVRLGDLVHRHAAPQARELQKQHASLFFNAFYNFLVPTECGARATWRRKLARHAAMFALETLPSRWMRAQAFLVISLVVVSALVFGCWPEFRTTAPHLFVKGHHIRTAREVRMLFEPLPGMNAVLHDELSNMHHCTVDAHDSAGCSMHKCETQLRSVVDQASGCQCYWQQNPDAGSCRGAAARVFGIEADIPDARYWDSFWNWTHARLQERNRILDGTGGADAACKDPRGCVSVPDWTAPLSLEDWRTGGVFIQHGAASTFTGDAGANPPRMEDACDRILCFCSEESCKPTFEVFGAGWESLCDPLYENCINLPDPSSNTPVSLASRFAGSGRRLSLAEQESYVDINVVFGLLQPMGPISRATSSQLALDARFKIEDPDAQRSILSFCEGTHPDLRIISRQCWVIDFKYWLLMRGQVYPVPAEDFNRFLLEFMQSYKPMLLEEEDSGTFWLNTQGGLAGFFVTFRIPRPEGKEEALVVTKKWEMYIRSRNIMASRSAGWCWLVPPFFVPEEELAVVRSAANSTIVSFIVLIGVFALLLTWSLGLSLAVMLAMLLGLTFFGVLAVGLGGRSVGAMDVIIMATFLACLSSPVLRFSQQYACSQDGPGPEPTGQRRLDVRSIGAIDTLTAARATDGSSSGKAPGEVPLWVGAIDAERRSRAAAAFLRTGDAVLAGGLAAFFAGPVLLMTDLEALGQTGLVILCACALAFPTALGALPVLFCSGFGPSRVWQKAVFIFVKWRIAVLGVDGPKPSSHEDAQAALAMAVLGRPFTGQLARARGEARSESITTSAFRKSRAFFLGQGGGDIGAGVGEEEGPHILALDVHGATAMPPYHVVMTVRDKFASDG